MAGTWGLREGIVNGTRLQGRHAKATGLSGYMLPAQQAHASVYRKRYLWAPRRPDVLHSVMQGEKN